jgi:GDP-4-dehydro-6-deoxy-D-mannose reductase
MQRERPVFFYGLDDGEGKASRLATPPARGIMTHARRRLTSARARHTQESTPLRALITGVGGFAGGHLAHHLVAQPETVVYGATFFPPERHPTLIQLGLHLQQIELTDGQAVRSLLEDAQPDHIYHLAAQSFVPISFEKPWDTLRNNILAQLNILQAMIEVGLNARVLVVGSGEEYGSVTPDQIPIDETLPLRPASPYSVSKVAQDMLGLQYFLSHNLPIVRVRPFNHIGPGQGQHFVAPAFAAQIAAIEAGQQERVIFVGNLEARRDFTDVRDVVRAYHLALTHGQPGEVYNVGTGQAHSIRELLDILLSLTDEPIEVRIDPALFRPVEVPTVVCNPAKLQAATGWTPQIPFEQSLADVLDDWRAHVGVTHR